jgi:5-methyltetrahydrofolate--homocysteine methyltransferase
VLIVGERINSSMKKVQQAIESKDSDFIMSEVKNQVEAGADVIDLNAGAFIGSETEDLVWLIDTADKILDKKARIAIDSVNPKAIIAALDELEKLERRSDDNKPIINSVTAEEEKLREILPLVKQYDAQLVGMCMGEQGIPNSAQERCDMGNKILDEAEKIGIPAEDLYLDALVMPISTDVTKGKLTLDTIKLLKELTPTPNTIVGLSNISYGLPMKPLINQTFLAMALVMGLDAALLNPLDKRLMAMLKAGDTILGRDDFCMKYITAYRNGDLEF